MTSVFTPTNLIHTINLRQLNFIQQKFKDFLKQYTISNNKFKSRLAEEMREFLNLTKNFKVDGLDNQTDRELSIFLQEVIIPKDFYDSGMYSRSYKVSFASLAQMQRHRTIEYNAIFPEDENYFKFFVPPIVEKINKRNEWVYNLKMVAGDFPQALLIEVYERGKIKDLRSKALLRLCGPAQLETMENVLETVKAYKNYQKVYGKRSLKPKCQQGMTCNNPCAWGGKKALERIV